MYNEIDNALMARAKVERAEFVQALFGRIMPTKSRNLRKSKNAGC